MRRYGKPARGTGFGAFDFQEIRQAVEQAGDVDVIYGALRFSMFTGVILP